MGRGAVVGMIDSRPQSAYNKLVGKGVVHVFFDGCATGYEGVSIMSSNLDQPSHSANNDDPGRRGVVPPLTIEFG